MIDQNQAFDPGFDHFLLIENRIFRAEWGPIASDCVSRAEYEQRLEAVAPKFLEACDTVPLEWWWVDDGVPATFDPKKVYEQLLASSHGNGLWGGAK